MRRPMTMLGLSVAAGLVSAGCGWDDSVDSRVATAGLPTTRVDLEARDWVLVRDDSSLTSDDDNPVSLSVTGDEVSGAAPCNIYTAELDLGYGDSVEIRDLVLTRRACEPATMDAEDEFVAALEDVDHVDVDVDDEGRDDADRMTLTGDDGLRLAFRSYDATDLLIGTWTVANVVSGDRIESVLEGTDPTLTFSDDDDLAFDTGCNTGGAEWELNGHKIDLGPVRMTSKACEDPPGVMDQETAIGTALHEAAGVEITPATLTLLDDGGSILLVAVR